MQITVIATGGTIGSRSDDSGIRTRAQKEQVIDQMLAHKPSGYPEFDLQVIYPFTLLSENMVPGDWKRLSEVIASEIKKGSEAIVITHGTDTMAYSLAALSFMLRPIPIPIVFTGALLPYGKEDSDAHQNLWDAVVFAGKHDYSGVYLVFQSPDRKYRSAYWGPRVQSIRPGGRFFETVDNRQIARIAQGGIAQTKDPFRFPKRKVKKININDQIDERIEVFKVYPGFNPKLLEGVYERGTRAVLIDLYHSGTACARGGANRQYSIIPAIRKLKEKNIAVLGTGAPLRASEQYRSTSALVAAGLYPLGHMSLESAVVKSMCLLGRGVKVSKLGLEMDKPLMKEIFRTP